MNRYAQIFRLGNCAIAVAGLVVAAIIASGASLADHWFQVLEASGVVFSFVAGGNALNDYLDRDVDRVAHPARPIPSGRMRAGTALRLSGGAFIVSFLLSLLLDPLSILIVVSAIAIMLAYELYTKGTGLGGNLSIAWLTAALFLLGGTVVGSVDRTLAIAAMAFLATLGREVIKDIQDVKADFDRRTLPMRIGVTRAGVVGSLSLLAAVALSPEPYLAGLFGWLYLMPLAAADAIFIYASIVHFRNPKRGQTWAKYAMLVALIAFLVGGFT